MEGFYVAKALGCPWERSDALSPPFLSRKQDLSLNDGNQGESSPQKSQRHGMD